MGVTVRSALDKSAPLTLASFWAKNYFKYIHMLLAVAGMFANKVFF